MDFDSLLSKYKAKACVVSIDFYEDETYGNIRILEGNKAHYDDMAAIGHPFVPNSPYEACFPQNRNFEDYSLFNRSMPRRKRHPQGDAHCRRTHVCRQERVLRSAPRGKIQVAFLQAREMPD